MPQYVIDRNRQGAARWTDPLHIGERGVGVAVRDQRAAAYPVTTRMIRDAMAAVEHQDGVTLSVTLRRRRHARVLHAPEQNRELERTGT